MKLLLDTQIYLWALDDSPRLSESARSRIVQADAVFVSAASIWEAAIKQSLGKLKVPVDRLTAGIAESGFTELPVTARHGAGVAFLPDHHKDPFDRLLVAQTIMEPLRLLTADSMLRNYSKLVELT